MKTKTEITYQIQRASKNAGFEDQAPVFSSKLAAEKVLEGERIKAACKDSGETFRLIERRVRVIASLVLLLATVARAGAEEIRTNGLGYMPQNGCITVISNQPVTLADLRARRVDAARLGAADLDRLWAEKQQERERDLYAFGAAAFHLASAAAWRECASTEPLDAFTLNLAARCRAYGATNADILPLWTNLVARLNRTNGPAQKRERD